MHFYFVFISKLFHSPGNVLIVQKPQGVASTYKTSLFQLYYVLPET
jgi:hypothetical protein